MVKHMVEGRGSKIIKCEYCGQKFKRSISRINSCSHHFCCEECRYAYMRQKNLEKKQENMKRYEVWKMYKSPAGKDLIPIKEKSYRYKEQAIAYCYRMGYVARSRFGDMLFEGIEIRERKG